MEGTARIFSMALLGGIFTPKKIEQHNSSLFLDIFSRIV